MVPFVASAASISQPGLAATIADRLHQNGPDALAVFLLGGGFLAARVAWTRYRHGPLVSRIGSPVVSVFGHDWPRPAFLDTAPGLFDQKYPATIPYTVIDGQPARAGVPPLRRNSAHAESRALESLMESTRWEMHRRGLRITDDTNRPIPLELVPSGILIERKTDSGRVVDLVAVGLGQPLEPDEYRAAKAAKIDRFRSSWDKRPFHLAHGKAGRWGRYNFDNPANGQMPLFSVIVREFVTQEAPRQNPFAPLSTERGSAQFAWFDQLQGRHAARLGSLRPSGGAGVPLGVFRVRDHGDKNDNRAGVVSSVWNGKDGEHRVIIGPPGSGKFTSVIAPLLLTSDAASVVVFDVANGEATRTAAEHRAKLGPVLVLDPFGLSGVPSGGLNPLDVLRDASAGDLLETAKRLTDAIFVPTGKESGSDSYFNDNARDYLTALLLHVATWKHEPTRTLGRVRQIIRAPLFEYDDNGNPRPSDELLEMKANTVCGGVVADVARNLLSAIASGAEKSVYFVTQTLVVNTSFLDLPSVQKVTERTTIDARDLRRNVGSLFVVVPEYQLATVGRWLRLVYASIMERTRFAAPVPLHIVIDEFPALGRFDRVAADMALVRKYGVSVHVAVQSLVQLKKLYGDGWETFMASAKYQQILGVNDQQTAEWVSKRLGKTTVRATSASENRSTAGGGASASASWAAADLMSADELSRMSPAECIVLVENNRPLRLRKWHFFESDHLKSRASRPAKK